MGATDEEEDAGMVEVLKDELSFRLPSRNVIETAYAELEELTDQVDEYSYVELVENRGDSKYNQRRASEKESDTVKDTSEFWFLNERCLNRRRLNWLCVCFLSGNHLGNKLA